MDQPGGYLIKGLAFAGVDQLSKSTEGFGARVLEQLSANDREYLDQLFLASGWYDAHVFDRLMRAFAAVEGIPFFKLARARAANAASEDIRGVYRKTLDARSAEEMAARLPRAFNRYFRPSRATLESVQSNGFEVSFAPTAPELRELMKAMNEGFIVGALESAGAEGVEMTWALPETYRFEKQRAERLRLTISWR